MKIIVGVDEVGRGCWAGPVVAGAVILDDARPIDGLRDSKKLSPRQRNQLIPIIYHQAVAAGLGWVSAAEVDEFGLSWAIKESGLRALRKLQVSFDHVVLDGKHNYLREELFSTEVIVGADDIVPSVSAASIIAKVARDRYMTQMSLVYPEFGFDRHMGYGTGFHLAALNQHGVTRLHRVSYKPVKRALDRVNN